jgi:DNA-directed RNA polymerase subunit M/transcription elongation factor TFIIS
MVSKGYGINCPDCDSNLEPEMAEVAIEDMVVPIRIFVCASCGKSFRWKSRQCPNDGSIMQESKRPMKEPLFYQVGLYCEKCQYFWSDKRNLVKIHVEEVIENGAKSS